MDPTGRRQGARPGAFQSPIASAGALIIHRARLASGLAFAGVLLVLVALGNQISTPLKPGDADVAQSRLAQVPLQTQELKFAAPETGAWMRLNQTWGSPSYILTVELARNEQGC